MTISDEGKRIRGRRLTEEEREAAKHVSFRLRNEITEKVRMRAKRRSVTQGAQMQQCIIDGLELEDMMTRVKGCIISTDPVLLANASGGAVPHVPESMEPTDAEALRFIRQAVQDAIRQRHREFEESQQLEEGSL